MRKDMHTDHARSLNSPAQSLSHHSICVRGRAVLSHQSTAGPGGGFCLQVNAINNGKLLWRSEMFRDTDVGALCANSEGDVFLQGRDQVLVFRVRARVDTHTLTPFSRA